MWWSRSSGTGTPPLPADAPIISPLLLTSDQAAAVLQLSPRTLWSLTQPRGPISAVRLGHLVRYDPRALVEWITAQHGAKGAHR